jgi:CheY-like chemotaxis protein
MPTDTTGQPEQVRVLIVDDAPDVRAVVQGVIDLHDRGWEVVAKAKDGLEGVETAGRVQPDLVLLDLSMPVMDGMEALPKVRAAAPGAVVVILTGYPGASAREAAFAAGADGYVEKAELVRTLIPQLQAVLAALPAPAGSEPVDPAS